MLKTTAFILSFALLGLIPVPVQADFVPEPPTYATFENQQTLLLYIGTPEGPLATSSVPGDSPMNLSYTLGYGPQLFSHPDYTPEMKEAYFLAMLEDYHTYLELWSGEPFTPQASVQQSILLPPTPEGSITLDALSPGNYFLVAYQTNTVRNEAVYCERNDISPEACAEDDRFSEYPLSETQAYFSRSLESEEPFSGAFPTTYAGTRLTVAPSGGASSVLFLPGIKGSRLYDSAGKKVWEPFGNHDIESLMLSPLGKSLEAGIHTTPDGIIDSVALFTDIYGSFSAAMDVLVSNGTIASWKALPYDWRLSLPDIIHGGTYANGRLSYTATSDLPAIRASLEELALSSKSGKVTIVAHSNGGLVAKELLRTLGDEEASRLIDTVILVGVPQSGAPQALAALLYGYREGLPWWFPGIVSTATARSFAENSPMGYHLLPSRTYLAQARDALVSFAEGLSFQKERAMYGESINTSEELVSFSLALEGGRTKPNPNNYGSANVLNADLLTYGNNVHDTLDTWTPPDGIKVYQIAGWGESTLTGIEYYEECVFSFCVPKYRPTFSTDGDGVVPVGSAHLMQAAQTYWIDLRAYGFGLEANRNHGTLLGIEELHSLIKDILLKTQSDASENILAHQPVEAVPKKEWRFFLHSPLTLSIFDEEGRGMGPSVNTLPDATYGQLGEVQYVLAPADETYRVELDGYESGLFSLDIQESVDGEILETVAFARIPTTADTIATLRIENNLEAMGLLEVDTDGDGTIDQSYAPHTEYVPEEARSKKRSGTRAPLTYIPEEIAVLGTTTEAVVLDGIAPARIQRATVANVGLTLQDSETVPAYAPTTDAPSTMYVWTQIVLNAISRFFAFVTSLMTYLWP